MELLDKNSSFSYGGYFQDMPYFDNINENSILRVRSNTKINYNNLDEVTCKLYELEISSELEDFKFMVRKREFCGKDLPGTTDMTSKINFMIRLLRTGLLQIVKI